MGQGGAGALGEVGEWAWLGGQESRVKGGAGGRIQDAGRRVSESHLIKISNDLVEQPQTLQPLMVDVRFRVEFLKVRDRRKEDADTSVGLVVEVL